MKLPRKNHIHREESGSQRTSPVESQRVNIIGCVSQRVHSSHGQCLNKRGGRAAITLFVKTGRGSGIDFMTLQSYFSGNTLTALLGGRWVLAAIMSFGCNANSNEHGCACPAQNFLSTCCGPDTEFTGSAHLLEVTTSSLFPRTHMAAALKAAATKSKISVTLIRCCHILSSQLLTSELTTINGELVKMPIPGPHIQKVLI